MRKNSRPRYESVQEESEKVELLARSSLFVIYQDRRVTGAILPRSAHTILAQPSLSVLLASNDHVEKESMT